MITAEPTLTAEEFYRDKIKEERLSQKDITLSNELITAEKAMRWAHEFKELHVSFHSKEIVELNKTLDYERKVAYNCSVDNAKLLGEIEGLKEKLRRAKEAIELGFERFEGIAGYGQKEDIKAINLFKKCLTNLQNIE